MADVLDRPASAQSTAKLVQQATEQISRLVRDELTLARLEIADKARQAGVGMGLAGAGGVLAFCGIGTLIVAAVLALALAMPAWLAAVIVAVVAFASSGLLLLAGRHRIKQAGSPVPKAVTDGVRADVRTVSDAVKSRGRG
ncbi:MAG TPA: phage holin family protein [Micromonospora sp.]